MKKRVVMFFRRAAAPAVLLTVLALLPAACASLGSAFREPSLSLVSVNIAGMDFTGADLVCRVDVDNPNAFTIPFPRIEWEFFVNANSFVSGAGGGGGPLKARQHTVVEVPVSVTWEGLYGAFQSLRNTEDAEYRIDLAAAFDLPAIGGKTWKLSHTGQIPLPKVPSIAFRGLKVKTLSLSRIEFELALEVENGNSFAMKVEELSYSFAVNGTPWVQGGAPAGTVLGAGKKTVIPVTFSLNALSMVTEITGIIARGTEVAYACGGGMKLGSDLPGLGPLDLPFDFSGKTKLGR
ncbi:MAG: LEA type 2 family protein [Treponema sp.]|nr:LEA type 2 family protein [Treponema sp.]